MFLQNKIFISQYVNTQSKVAKNVLLIDELNKIKNGYYKESVELCRNFLELGQPEKYKQAKSNLPAVTFSGIFSQSHKLENLLVYNKLIVIDVDGLPIETIEEQRKVLYEDIFVLAVWISPSNRGIKVLINTDSNQDTHKIYFNEISNYLKLKYDLNVDKSGCDICRLCFSSYDPNLLIKRECRPFKIDVESIALKLLPEPNDTTKGHKQFAGLNLSDSKVDKLLFYSTENRNKARDRTSITKIIKYLTKKGYSITSNYNDWYKVGLAISNTFTFDLGKKYFLDLCRLDGLNHDEYKSLYLLEYCYRNRKLDQVNFASILYLTEQKGFSLNKSN
jgi:hypothetical protein